LPKLSIPPPNPYAAFLACAKIVQTPVTKSLAKAIFQINPFVPAASDTRFVSSSSHELIITVAVP